MSFSLARLMQRRAAEHPTRLLLAGAQPMSYGDVHAQSTALAAALAACGVRHGDRIAINLPNTPEWVVTLLSSAQLGATVVPLNPRLNYHELRYQLRHADATVAVTHANHRGTDFLPLFRALLNDLPSLKHVVTIGAPDGAAAHGTVSFEALLQRGRGVAFSNTDVDDASDLAIIYTSGSIGKPKGVRLSHRTIVACSARGGEAMHVTPGDMVLCAVPLCAIFGFTVVVGTIAAGATMVLQESFEARTALDLIEREKVTVLYGVPTMYQLLMREPDFSAERVQSVRIGAVAGGPVSDDLVRRVRAWCDLQIAYGITETGPTVSITRGTDTPEKRMTSVGKPLAGVEVVAVDPVTHEALAPGAIGEIGVRGWNVMSGYERMPVETARSFTAGGYFLTGDLGYVDQDGYVHIVGRSREVILRAGYQVYPREVEEPLNAHPAVDDVCVIGVPHEILGELICACIVPVEGAVITGEEIKDFARATMAAHKIPDIVHFLNSFPLTGSGKVKRRELERTVASEYTETTGST